MASLVSLFDGLFTDVEPGEEFLLFTVCSGLAVAHAATTCPKRGDRRVPLTTDSEADVSQSESSLADNSMTAA